MTTHPAAPRGIKHLTPARRVELYVDSSGGPGACWPWTACITEHGYGRTTRDGKHLLAHRMTYEVLVGPIPDGLTLDHTCHRPQDCVGECLHRRCCNPAHLEPVSIQENIRRSGGPSVINAAKELCPQGHEYNYIRPRGGRDCWTCNNAAKRARRAARSGSPQQP